MTQHSSDPGGDLDPSVNSHAPEENGNGANGKKGNPNGHEGIHPDHARFLYEMGYRMMPPDQEDYNRSMAVDAEWTQYIERQDARRRANGTPSAAEQAWKESVENYDAKKRHEMITSWARHHRTMASKHRANLTQIVARHEAAAAMYEGLL